MRQLVRKSPFHIFLEHARESFLSVSNSYSQLSNVGDAPGAADPHIVRTAPPIKLNIPHKENTFHNSLKRLKTVVNRNQVRQEKKRCLTEN